MGLSIRAYARLRGVSHNAVLKAIKSGRVATEHDGTIDPAKADAAWERNTDNSFRRASKQTAQQPAPRLIAEPIATEPVNQSGGPNFAQSRAIREAYNARLAKLAYEERSGALVKIDAVKVAWFNVLRVLRDRTLNLPDRLSPLLASEHDAKVIRDILENELRLILNDAADTTLNINTN